MINDYFINDNEKVMANDIDNDNESNEYDNEE